jgi:hypothetical protein
MGRNSIGDSAVQFSFKDEQQKVAKRSKNPLVGRYPQSVVFGQTAI